MRWDRASMQLLTGPLKTCGRPQTHWERHLYCEFSMQQLLEGLKFWKGQWDLFKYSPEGRSCGIVSAAGVEQGRINRDLVEVAAVAAASIRPLRDSLFGISSLHLQAAAESSRSCCQELKRHQLGSKNIANLLHHRHENFISHDGTTFNTSAIHLNPGADRFKSGSNTRRFQQQASLGFEVLVTLNEFASWLMKRCSCCCLIISLMKRKP